MTGLEAALSAMEASIERFKQILPPVNRPTPSSADSAHSLFIVHGFTYAATIQLHRGFMLRSMTSTAKSLSAANNIVRTASGVGLQSVPFVNPVVGVSV